MSLRSYVDETIARGWKRTKESNERKFSMTSQVKTGELFLTDRDVDQGSI